MNAIVENLTGTAAMTDQVIAFDLLIAAKAGVKTYATALTETTTPQIRAMLRKQLDQAITNHEQISNYMIKKGWYNPFQVKQQIQQDLQNAKTAMGLA